MKELTYQIEAGPDDTLYTFVYEIEPYNPGVRYYKDGSGEPPSGGYATIYEIRRPDGSILPEDSWASAGMDEKFIEQLQETIYEYHSDMERARREAYEEDRANRISESD